MQHELHIVGVAGVLINGRIPVVDDVLVERCAVAVQEDIGLGLARIAKPGPRGVVAPAERGDQTIVQEVALPHDAGGLDGRLAVESAAGFVRGHLAERNVIGVAGVGEVGRGAGAADPVEGIGAVSETGRGVLDLCAVGAADVIPILTLGVLDVGGSPGRGTLEPRIVPRGDPGNRRVEGVAPGILAVHAVLVFAVTRELERAQPFEQIALLGEVESVGELGA